MLRADSISAECDAGRERPLGLVVALLGLCAALGLAACGHGPETIPAPAPNSTRYDTPSAAERHALGSDSLGTPSRASPADAGLEPLSEDDKLAATASIDRAKKAAALAAPDGGLTPAAADGGATR